MAFNASDLSVVSRAAHEDGVLKIFAYTTAGDNKATTKGSSYFDHRFFSGGDVVKVTASDGSYIGVWTYDNTGLMEI